MSQAANYLSSATTLAQKDFCPWVNRYVYWLKEPVGWFVLATLASVLVGIFLSPIGWTLAVGLVSLISLGLAFPWLATRCVRCQVRPVHDQMHERQSTEFELTVRNYLPVPVVGLVLEKYFDGESDRNSATEPSITPGLGLERVPALCSASYRLPVSPEYRGKHPVQSPTLACAFPFGIWTARSTVQDFTPLTVLPLLIPVTEELQMVGKALAEVGRGERASDHGDFIGVRQFRRGDSLKSIHWAQSARLDELVICERGGPQKQAVELRLETGRCCGEAFETRENLAWRVRIAASLIDLLAARHLPYELFVDGRLMPTANGSAGRLQALRYLADVPLDSIESETHSITPATVANASASNGNGARISITAKAIDQTPLESGLVRIEAILQSDGLRKPTATSCIVDLDLDIADQLNHWLAELGHVHSAA